MKKSHQLNINTSSDTETGSIVSSNPNKPLFKDELQEAIRTSFQEEFVYEFAKNEKNLTTVTIEPLVKQVETVFNNCKKIDQSKMSEDEKRGVQFTLESTNQVYHFLTALLAEAHIKLNPEENQREKNTTH